MDINLIITLLSSALAIYIGTRIKASNMSNQVIPWITLTISFLTQLLNQFGPAEAFAAVAAVDSSNIGAAVAVVSRSFFQKLLIAIANAVLQTIGITGTVSFAKNAVFGDVSKSRGK